MAQMRNWERCYLLRAGVEGQKGFEIGSEQATSRSLPHISFNVEKSDSASPNNTTLQIWNLSDESIAVLEQEYCIVELHAGYEGSLSLIFVGEVEDVITNMDGADRLTEVTIVDGMKSIQESNISISLKGKVPSSKVYTLAASKMSLPLKRQTGLKYVTYPFGYSFVGKVSDMLDKLAAANNHAWSIQNGILQIVNKGEGIEHTGFLLSPTTGLCSIPKRIKIGSNDTKEKGWEVEFFLNGAVAINDVIRLESRIATGDFRVYKLTMAGDNLGGDWKCTAQLVDIDY